MLHGYKKSKYNIYDNLEFLGLNPYEQKYFCFGEGNGEGSGDGVDEGAPTSQEAQDEQDEAQGIGIDEAEATNLAGLIDDLAATNNLGALDTGYQGISVEDKAQGLQDAMDRGDIGYNEAVEAGFVSHVEQAERNFDLNLARSIADKYGLDPSQVQPGFMQDPAYGPQTMSYRGPGAPQAAFTEMAKAAAELGLTLAEMYPSPVKMALTIAEKEGLIDVPSLGLKEGVKNAFDEITASQRETNRAARGVTETEQASSIDRSQPQSSTDEFDAPQTLSQQVAAAPEGYNPAIGMADPAFEGRSGVSYTGSPFSGLPTESFESYMNAMTALQEAREQEAAAPYDAYGFGPQDFKSKESTATPEQAPSSVDYFDALINTTSTPSTAKDFYGGIPDGNETIPRIIPQTPTATPTPEPEVKVVRPPVTRTAATDTLRILTDTYGPEIAAQLLPNRIV